MRPPSTESAELPTADAVLERMAQALVAREGFGRVAAIASEVTGARVEVLVPRPGSEGRDGSARERFVADLVDGGLPAWPAGVCEVVPITVDGQVHGAVVASGELAPGGEEHLRSAAQAALTGIAILDTRAEARRASATGLIADLLAGRRLASAEIAERAHRLGCDLRSGFFALAIEAGGDQGVGEVEAALAAVAPGALVEARGRRVLALVPGEEPDGEALAAELGESVARAHSSAFEDPGQAGRALDEVLFLLDLARETATRNTDRSTWDSLRILHGAFAAEPERLAAFRDRTVGELIRSDAVEGGRLQRTFWTYQEANCNMNVAAERLATHRHTVANRLRRIRLLTGLDPQRAYDRELLGLALRVHLVAASDRT